MYYIYSIRYSEGLHFSAFIIIINFIIYFYISVHTKRKKGINEGKKILKLSNDELFYDPNMDDDDERWVERQRQSYHNGN